MPNILLPNMQSGIPAGFPGGNPEGIPSNAVLIDKLPPNFDPFRCGRMMMKVNIKKLYKNAEIPSYSTDGSAACDIHVYPEMDYSNPEDEATPKSRVIQPGEIYMCHVGFATEFDWNWVALVYNRSGMVTKRQLGLPAGVYVIDSDYRGEWTIPLQNKSNVPQTIESGDRIAQVIWQQCPRIDFDMVETLKDSDRGTGGFGSTGK